MFCGDLISFLPELHLDKRTILKKPNSTNILPIKMKGKDKSCKGTTEHIGEALKGDKVIKEKLNEVNDYFGKI